MGDYGLNQTFEYVELSLDSFDASSSGGDPNDPSIPANILKYSWPMYYFTTKQLNVAAFKILSAEIPFVYDVISNLNNQFIFTNNGIPNTITIPRGTYTGPQLAATLQVLFVAISPTMTVVWNSQYLKFEINHPAAVPWSLQFMGETSPYAVMGFEPTTATSTFIYSLPGAGTIVSESIAQVTGPYYLYINSRTQGSLVNFNLADGCPQPIGPQLCKVPVNVQFGSVIFYNDPGNVLLTSA